MAEDGRILQELGAEGIGVLACMLGGDGGHTLFACVAPTFHQAEASANHQAAIWMNRVSVPHAGLPERLRPRLSAGNRIATARAMVSQVLKTGITGNPHGRLSSISPELRNDRRDVVVLFLRSESPNFIHDCGQQILARELPMSPQRFHQPLLAKFFAAFVTGFGDAIRVKRKHIARRDSLLPQRAIPSFEQTQQRAGRFKLLQWSNLNRPARC